MVQFLAEMVQSLEHFSKKNWTISAKNWTSHWTILTRNWTILLTQMVQSRSRAMGFQNRHFDWNRNSIPISGNSFFKLISEKKIKLISEIQNSNTISADIS